jgi:hypothetical protein
MIPKVTIEELDKTIFPQGGRDLWNALSGNIRSERRRVVMEKLGFGRTPRRIPLKSCGYHVVYEKLAEALEIDTTKESTAANDRLMVQLLTQYRPPLGNANAPEPVREGEVEVCPDCRRRKARTIGAVIKGDCPKWYATHDAEAEEDCRRYARHNQPGSEPLTVEEQNRLARAMQEANVGEVKRT